MYLINIIKQDFLFVSKYFLLILKITFLYIYWDSHFILATHFWIIVKLRVTFVLK